MMTEKTLTAVRASVGDGIEDADSSVGFWGQWQRKC